MNGCNCDLNSTCPAKNDSGSIKSFILPAVIFIIGLFVYIYLKDITDYLVYTLMGLDASNHFSMAIHFFIFEVPKVLLLLTVIVFVVGIIRSYFSPEKTRKSLEGKPLFVGNVMASMLGIVTPFCSCSAIPLFIGFMESGIPVGVTFSFLIAAPMINEIALVLLFGLFGWKTALLYVTTGLFIAISAGWIIGKLNVKKYIEPWVLEIKAGSYDPENQEMSLKDRINAGYSAVKEIVAKVWIYIMAGIGVGAFIHGYVPENFMASFMGKTAWWSVPAAVVLGIPMYSNAAGIIPIVQSLLEKGASLGTTLAFMMSVIGLSLPEMIILKKVIKLPLIIMFAGIVGSGIMLVGFIFNLIF